MKSKALENSEANVAEQRRSSHSREPGDHYPADQAEENISYQKLAWYSAPFGSTGVAVLVLAVLVNSLKSLGRLGIRLLTR